MSNLTISIEDDLLNDAKRYTKKHNISINGLIRKLLKDTVRKEGNDWLDEVFRKMDKAKANSKGKTWRREDLYDV